MKRQTRIMVMAQAGRYIKAAIWTLVALVGASCHNPDDYALNADASPSLDRFLTLEAAGETTLPADGVSAVELVAKVRDVTEGPVVVQFTTTAGSLRVGAIVGSTAQLDSLTTVHRPDSVVVRTDASGEARVELVSVSQPHTARVRATVLGVDAPIEQVIRIDFASAPAEDLLVFVDAPDSAFAQGLSLVPVTVHISAQLEGENRDVRFETTGGTFPFTNDSSGVLIVSADTGGQATANLRSPEASGEVQVRATAAGFSQQHLIHFIPAPTDSVLRFVDVDSSAPADGETLTDVTVVISPLLQRSEDRTVVFTTTGGTFPFAGTDGSTVSVRADADGVAKALLRSPTRFGEAVVQASVKGFTQDDRILFDWAGPDSIVVRPERSRLQLTTSEQMQVQAELIRLEQRGQVTEGLPVRFTATDSLDQAVPGARFLEVTRTDVVGVATAVFVVEDTLYWGPITISAQTDRPESTVVGQTQVTILRP